MIIKELFELFDRFYKEFIKLTFYHYIKIHCNEIKLIIKCKRFRCIC